MKGRGYVRERKYAAFHQSRGREQLWGYDDLPSFVYYDYFKQYRIKRHDIRFIDYESIFSLDVVILGGGGLLDYAESINRAINRVLDTGAAVIAWAPDSTPTVSTATG